MTTYGEIKISGFSDILQVLALSFQQGINTHSRANFKGMLKEGINPNQLQKKLQNETITIVSEKSGSERKLFVGYLDTIDIDKKGEGLYYVEVNLLSTSCKLDQRIKNRSFQDISLTHEQVIEEVAKETQMATVLWNIGESTAIGKPVIQYIETDWEFIVRMASYYGYPVLPSMTENSPVLSIGYLKSEGAKELIVASYKSGVSDAYYTLGGSSAGISKEDYFYYKVETTRAFRVGQAVSFQGVSYMICDMEARLYQSELIYTYTLGQDMLKKVRRIYNTNFIGHTILGTVIETEAETIKLHLDLSDEGDNDATAYPYEWTPESGNIMYCMPQKGTIASLYFSDADEASGAVVNCIRTNGATSKYMEKPSNKHFTTEDGLTMCLKDEVIDFALPEAEDGGSFAKCILPEEYGVAMLTQGQLTIAATNDIEITGARVGIWTESNLLSLVAYNQAPSCILLNYQFDIRGELTKIITSEMSYYSRINDAPTVSKCDIGKLAEGILWGALATLAVTAVVVGTIALCATGVGAVVAGSVYAAAAAGGLSCGFFTTGYMAYLDVKNGTNTDSSKYALRAGTQAFIGAVSGAVAGSALAKKFITFGTNYVGKGAATFIVKDIFEAGFNVGGQAADNFWTGTNLKENLAETAVLSIVSFGLLDGEVGLASKLSSGYKKFFNYGGDIVDEADDLVKKRIIAKEAVKEATNDVATAESVEQAAKAAKDRAKEKLNIAQNKGKNKKAANVANRAAKEEFKNAKAVTKAAEEALGKSQNKFQILAQACGENNMKLKQLYLTGGSIKIATDYYNGIEKMLARQVSIDLSSGKTEYDVEFEQMFIE